MTLDATWLLLIGVLLAALAVGLFAAALASPGSRIHPPRTLPQEETQPFDRPRPGPLVSPLQLRMASAGLKGRGDAAWFFVLQIALALLLPLGLLAAAGSLSIPPLGRNLFAIGAALLGFGLPRWVLGERIEARRARIRRSLPDLADLVVGCLEGGLGLQAALRRAVTELAGAAPSLCLEMMVLLDSWALGGDQTLPVDALLRRTGVVELGEFGRSLEEAQRSHSDVIETLRRFAEHQRMEDASRVRTWAKRAPIHVALVQAIFMLPSTAAILVGPALIRAMKSLAALIG